MLFKNLLEFEFTRFAFVGFINTLVGSFLFYSIIWFNFDYQAALLISWLVATLISYFLTIKFVFSYRRVRKFYEESFYFILLAVAYFFSFLITIETLKPILGIYISYACAIPILFLIRFLISKIWIFKRDNKDNA